VLDDQTVAVAGVNADRQPIQQTIRVLERLPKARETTDGETALPRKPASATISLSVRLPPKSDTPLLF
jgi:hypothetical protein